MTYPVVVQIEMVVGEKSDNESRNEDEQLKNDQNDLNVRGEDPFLLVALLLALLEGSILVPELNNCIISSFPLRFWLA